MKIILKEIPKNDYSPCPPSNQVEGTWNLAALKQKRDLWMSKRDYFSFLPGMTGTAAAGMTAGALAGHAAMVGGVAGGSVGLVPGAVIGAAAGVIGVTAGAAIYQNRKKYADCLVTRFNQSITDCTAGIRTGVFNDC